MDRISYPIFMAGVFKVFGQNLMIIRIIQVFIYAGLVLLIYKFCQDFFGERTAKLAGFIAAVSYTLASFTGWLYREIIFTTLVFLLVYLLYQAQRREKNIWFVLAGLVFGLAVLTNSIIQFFLFPLNLFLFKRRFYYFICFDDRRGGVYYPGGNYGRYRSFSGRNGENLQHQKCHYHFRVFDGFI